ncbi:MAG TPA: sortase [Longilinea sp.]|nr:sortase [Longilinea sp.]
MPISFPAEDQQGAPTLQPSATPPGNLNTVIKASATPISQIEPTRTEVPSGPLIPDRIVIPAIKLDAPVIPAIEEKIKIGKDDYLQFKAPDKFAAGWHPNSAPLGEVGNTVLNGHHNIHGKVFGRLVDLAPGDRIIVYSGTTLFNFQVANVLILPERDADLSVRLENARWIEPSNDIRLTLVTCWPDYSNTHRLVIVASLIPDGLDRSE